MSQCKFSVGQLIRHKLFEYRGVIVDVDAEFSSSEEWYESVARTRPPKDRPWYRVLVDGASHETYVAERNLEADDSERAIEHPEVHRYFDKLEGGRYVSTRRFN